MAKDKRYPIRGNNGNTIENSTINLNNSNLEMNSFSINGDNTVRNNIIDMVNSKLKQTSYGFACRNIMDNNKIKLKNSTIEQSCVIIIREKGMRRPHIRVMRRTLRGR